ncbi:hypothetical protein ACFL5Z_18400 [Planctomycetota bacterium]
MMKKILIMTCILALGLPLGLTGCNQGESENLKNQLAQTEFEKDVIEVKMREITRTRDELQNQVKELTEMRDQLTESRDQLKAQLAEHYKLQEQVDELVRFRTRLQKENDELAQKLETGTQKVGVLEEQLERVQAAVAELQGTIKL